MKFSSALRKISLGFIALVSLTLAGCGGGGGGSSGGNTGTTTGTAAQYFTKNAAGNTWTYFETGVLTVTGQPAFNSSSSQIYTITALTGGVVTGAITYPTGGAPVTYTEKIDATGALIFSDGAHQPVVQLPATFSAGTTWTSLPADSTTGRSATAATITAFNVTRTVPAGKFTDCLQINSTWTETTAGVTTTANEVSYVSPSTGMAVEYIYTFSSTNGGVNTNQTVTNKLQAGYIANTATQTALTATANTTAQNLTVGTAMNSFTPLTASGGTMPYTYLSTGTLPAGLSLNASTGAITGTPTAAYTTANVVFSVKDANNVMASTTSTVSFTASVATGTTGTAAQYFTKKAVGNTWTDSWTETATNAGQLTSTTGVDVNTITAYTGGVVTYSTSSTSNGVASSSGGTSKLDVSGALVSTYGTQASLDLPATFTVGTTWIQNPGNSTFGQSATNATIVAFNVTRTVPAGTFTDCLQLNQVWSVTNGGVITTHTTTGYISPTAGTVVDVVGTSSGSDGSTGTFTSQLQAGYVANP